LTEPCGALPRKCLFIHSSPEEIHAYFFTRDTRTLLLEIVAGKEERPHHNNALIEFILATDHALQKRSVQMDEWTEESAPTHGRGHQLNLHQEEQGVQSR
jgi:hypothetical protein